MQVWQAALIALLCYLGALTTPWVLGTTGGWYVITRPLVAGFLCGLILVLRFAAPSGVKLEALTVEKAAERLRDLSKGNDRIILLTKVPRTFLHLVEKGYRPSDINFGAMAHKANSRNVAPNCDLSAEEIADAEKLHQQNIRIWIQLVPFGGQKPIEWGVARKKAGLK
ncbi:MAG: PTS sugar transporter subunit IIB [Ktedonobacteraceae bacterium]|nr:PTS sugar transporter subunit IIB [Ktedonobacteraceae bacterium]